MPSLPPVSVSRTQAILPTYLPLAPDRNPLFLEKRVYQGSSGRVYPLPCTDRVEENPRPFAWDTIFIENEFIQVMILPALGGRIHRILDKTNNYDAIYYQPVIKPALVGLAGPWASGGIEFNWPQHHRPSTFMPTDVAFENHDDGSATVWLSEHDPMARMKGMHGVRLHPGRSYVEVVGRVYNRTSDVQTFLWWANVAVRVHEQYQSFFPPDVTHVADHAKRATGTYPLCSGKYYGIDYGKRAREGIPPGEQPRHYPPAHGQGASTPAQPARYAPNDLTWYANIPVPTSYMCMGSQEDFSGGYDHRARAGLVQVVDHHIAPGKKQWTWGNHDFGYAWDRNLTDSDANGEFAPYLELMVGVYTDNQPDFSFLQPGETKDWRQFWYPIREIGPAQHANVDAALSLRLENGVLHLGVITTAAQPRAAIQLERRGKIHQAWQQDLSPTQPFLTSLKTSRDARSEEFTLRVVTHGGRELIAYAPKAIAVRPVPTPATAPPAPADAASNDELFMIGQHLEQYRHATRQPEAYWREALRRDRGDSRCHLALGRWHLRRGERRDAETHLRASIARLTSRNPNPYDGEAYYQLGLCLRHEALFTETKSDAWREKISEAYAAFYKSTWNQAWQPAGYHALAEIDALRGHWNVALDHLGRALRVNTENLRARNLQVIALRHLGRESEAEALLAETLRLDPLDWWARHLQGQALTCDVQVRFDLAHDYARAGLFLDGLAVLAGAKPVAQVNGDALADASLGTEPLLHYYRAWLCHQLGQKQEELAHLRAAAKASPDYSLPARLEEIAILEYAIARQPGDARAPFFLGNLLYDRLRHPEAIVLWRNAVKNEPDNAVAWRNLGLGYFNLHRRAAARHAYERAFRAAPTDARLLYERDQLWKRLGVPPLRRLRELQRHPGLVGTRDDLSIELCALLNQTGRPDLALPIISTRKFQPWEGGEGLALGQHRRTHLALGRRALREKDPARATTHLQAALATPENLGEAKHLLSNQSDLHYWLACAFSANGDEGEARRHWTVAADSNGDFQTMSVCAYSEKTYYSALSYACLGQKSAARKLLRDLLAHARKLAESPASIDYFATSLPTMLLFDEDLLERQSINALFLKAQARLGLAQSATARRLLRAVLQRDPNHAGAADLLT